MERDNIIVWAEGMRIGYGKKTVAQDIHFSLRKGEILAVTGPNGSGKSTLLKTVAGFLPMQGGKLILDGVSAKDMRRGERARFMSVVTTLRPDVEWMKVWDVAASGRYPYTGKLGILSDDDRKIVWEALKRMQAEDLSGLYFNELSDGQKQRALLAKSIAQRPKLLVLDEPTSYLDIRHILEFIQTAGRLAREDGMALMMSVHELSIVRNIADQVLTIKNGRQDKTGDPGILTEAYVRELYDIPEDMPIGGIYAV